ncbi:uncharacterized protein SCHCODRAFT_02706054 [Schizophyllum commune H4-8]|uniref:Uncharacterized protein n=1 Tax=Schizophyllum commune (strain H4-8 / FGSC 9210) TaxID=578458 RepID=D8QJ43_SCHCM|nr:uncharacterized protein SCHCODRAFT_02706054 [Schizophyllum commune H4-8]KAI5886494.1 hypothetical protein SCHCODRAFT_02706054 [Schizophyllum commune H4-8]
MSFSTEENSIYLRRVQCAGLPWFLICPLESDIALEIRDQVARHLVLAGDAESPQVDNVSAAATATDTNAATATSVANVVRSATPVFESAASANSCPTSTDYLTEFAKELDILVAEPNATSAAQN